MKIENKYFQLSPHYLRIGGCGKLRKYWVNHWVLEFSYVNHRKSYTPEDYTNKRKEVYFGIFKLLEYYEAGLTDKFKKMGFFNIFIIN